MFELNTSRKIILSILALSVGVMLVTSFTSRMGGGGLVQNSAQMPSGQNDADALAAEIGKHMQELKSDPNNYSTLVHTSDLLLQSKQWEAAESFLQRAIAIDNTKSHPYYLLGIALYNLKKNAEAATAFEKVLSMEDNPGARYNLMMLYTYFLDDKAKGAAHLLKALESPKLEQTLKTILDSELEKIDKSLLEEVKKGMHKPENNVVSPAEDKVTPQVDAKEQSTPLEEKVNNFNEE